MQNISTIKTTWRNSMKKKLVLTMMMSALLFSRAAADFPVIDIVHILETIHVGLQTYQQVQNTIKQLEY